MNYGKLKLSAKERGYLLRRGEIEEARQKKEQSSDKKAMRLSKIHDGLRTMNNMSVSSSNLNAKTVTEYNNNKIGHDIDSREYHLS